ncbi:MAG: alpha-amylase family glycosyl hydrolase [Promethearchaeota archaeon]
MPNIFSIPWWKKTTVYQIYPRSFYDSTGNGIGDLQGIISKLDYIKECGFETIWFSPFYDSPQRDFGYDIRNFRDVAPEYGSLVDADQLIEEIHARGMKIVMDMVLNHTSEDHPFFVESRSNRENPKRDWYVWRDGKKPNGKAPPNNWNSQISGSGWHYDSTTDQWYWAAFLPFQPDLNFRNPAVQAEMLDTIRFWLDKGVDGFRLDILGSLFEDSEFRDNPFKFKLLPSESDPGMMFQSAKMTINHPDTLEFTKKLRDLTNEYSPARFLVGEVFGSYETIRKYCGESGIEGIHSVFQFQTLEAKFGYEGFGSLLHQSEKWFPDPYVPTWAFSNHDRTRRISLLGNNVDKAKLIAAFQFTARGVPYTYYGEEIGMQQVGIPISEAKDGLAFKFKKYPKLLTNALQKFSHGALSRDGCRTPMQWSGLESESGEFNAGFSSKPAEPWLQIGPEYLRINVEEQKKDPDSIWNCYSRFLEIRARYPALHAGKMEVFDPKTLPPKVLAYKRTALVNGIEQKLYIFLNFNKSVVQFPSLIEEPKLIASTTILSQPIDGSQIILQPLEVIVISREN